MLSLHEARDGGLARVRLPGGRIDASQLAAIASAARLGSGLVELTSRANLQLRGVGASSRPALAAVLRAGGLLPSDAHDRARNLLASPLAGRHPRALAHVDDVVARLDRELLADAALAALPGRFLIAVDDGSAVLGDDADIALTATGAGAFQLALGGLATTLAAPRERAAALALAAARAFLALRDHPAQRRIGELADGPARIARGLGGAATVPLGRRAADATLAPGIHVQLDGRRAVAALAPLGRLEASTARALADEGRELRVSPWRTLTAVDLEAEPAEALAARLRRLGLVLAPGSGWERLSACAGVGACANARVDVRAAAERRAQLRGARAPVEHWAACERRCGEPRDAAIAVAGAGERLAVDVAGKRHDVATVAEALALLRRAEHGR